MTVADIELEVDVIEAVAKDMDDERAHGLEDSLWEEVLRAIADGATDPHRLALAALRTKRIKFSRWCA